MNGLNSDNNAYLADAHISLKIVLKQLDNVYHSFKVLTEEQYREVYYLRGIVNNLEAIVTEVDKGIQGGFVSQRYFDEKSDKLVDDLKGYVETHRDNVTTHFSTKVVPFNPDESIPAKEIDFTAAIEEQQEDLAEDRAQNMRDDLD